MKILFCANECIPIHAKTLQERPLGGTETGVIRLAHELQELGHDVTVLTRHPNPPLSVPLYLPLTAINQLGTSDILISIRDWKPLFLPINANRRFLWTGDSWDQPSSVGVGDRRIAERIDGLLCVSEWHKETFCRASGFPASKAWVIGNGVHLEYFQGEETRARKRLVYSSTPYRGLVHLIDIFPRILASHPDAELHLFTGYDVYSGTEPYPEHVHREFRAVMQKFQLIPNVYFRGNIRQQELAREFMRAAVLAYPNTFEETSCISAMEAQAAACVPVTSRKAGLIETVGDAGILIDGAPGTEEYSRRFAEAVNVLLSDDDFFHSLQEKGKIRAAQEFSWKKVAERFVGYLERFTK